MAVSSNRSVSFLLGLGIVFFPWIFVWFLLRRGYSKQARILGFGWLALLLLPLVFSNNQQQGDISVSASSPPQSVQKSDPQKQKSELSVAQKEAQQLLLHNPKGTGVYVSKKYFGNLWPLILDEGVVDCVKGAAIYMYNGEAYALTGFAQAQGYKNIDVLWADNPDIPTTKIYIGDLTDVALKQCDK